MTGSRLSFLTLIHVTVKEADVCDDLSDPRGLKGVDCSLAVFLHLVEDSHTVGSISHRRCGFKLRGEAWISQTSVAMNHGVASQVDEVSSRHGVTSNVLSAVSPTFLALSAQFHIVSYEFVDNLLVAVFLEDCGIELLLFVIFERLEIPVLLIFFLGGELEARKNHLKNGIRLVENLAVVGDPDRERAAHGSVSSSCLGSLPLLLSQALILVLDAFERECIANGLSLTLDVEIDESWHTCKVLSQSIN